MGVSSNGMTRSAITTSEYGTRSIGITCFKGDHFGAVYMQFRAVFVFVGTVSQVFLEA